MDKEQIKQIIGENQEFVKDITFMERPFTFEDAGNYVFLGIRRAGKSYFDVSADTPTAEKRAYDRRNTIYQL